MKILAVHDITYHRNGICGQGWHGVYFEMIEDGRMSNMHLTFFDPEVYAVVGLDNFTETWRGDVIVEELKEFAIEGAKQDEKLNKLAGILQR